MCVTLRYGYLGVSIRLRSAKFANAGTKTPNPGPARISPGQCTRGGDNEAAAARVVRGHPSYVTNHQKWNSQSAAATELASVDVLGELGNGLVQHHQH